MFIMSHSNQILRTLPLIGNITNIEFKSFLQKSSFSLEKDILNPDYIPSLKANKQVINLTYGDEFFKASGYEILTTDYVFIWEGI